MKRKTWRKALVVAHAMKNTINFKHRMSFGPKTNRTISNATNIARIRLRICLTVICSFLNEWVAHTYTHTHKHRMETAHRLFCAFHSLDKCSIIGLHHFFFSRCELCDGMQHYTGELYVRHENPFWPSVWCECEFQSGIQSPLSYFIFDLSHGIL